MANSHDALIDQYRKWQSYPSSLLRTNELQSALEKQRHSLENNESRLFTHRDELLHFLEIFDGDDSYNERSIRNSDELGKHLLQNRKDPKCRHIFLNAEDSRAPLNCSRQSFCSIATFHQIVPGFLEYVSSFGDSSEPLDYCMTGFHSEDTLGAATDNVLNIPKLDRSGCEHKLQYLLRSVERSSDIDEPWKVRQMAVYHTFDFLTGRAFWMNIKANDLMKERVKEATSQFPELTPNAIGELTASFTGTLTTHLIHLEWCDENWRECINDAESKIRKILVKAKTAPIDRQRNFGALAYQRAMTMKSQRSTAGDINRTRLNTLPESVRTLGQPKFSKSVPESQVVDTRPTSKPAQSRIMANPSSKNDDFNEQLETLLTLDMFSFEEVQKLYHIGEQLKKMRLVIQLNDQVIRDIWEYFDELPRRNKFPRKIETECKRPLGVFLRRLDRIRKNLEIRKTQVESMISWLSDGQVLFDGILQYRSVQVSGIFTQSSQMQSEKMERIAYKTEKETISMHIITSVTLAFLPGTFVAAFFQSGLIGWKEGAAGIKEAVIFNLTGFGLFAAICFPLMLLTFILWGFLFRYLTRRARRRLEENEG
ncbi:Fc.00g002180.m01.CDS01 [Cosmosporella sp. VM-42]